MADAPRAPGGADRSRIRSIALVTSSALSLTNFRLPLIAALSGAGLRVWALAPEFDAETRRLLTGAGAIPVEISLERTGMRPLRDLADAARLTRVLRRLRPDAVFSYFIKPIIYGSVAAKRAGVPRRFALMAGMGYVFTLGERPSRRRRLLRAIVERLYRRAFGACERVYFHNGDDLDEMVAMTLLPREKGVLLSGTGVDLEHFSPAPPVERPFRFLLAARLLREKGITEYVEAARTLRQHWPDVEFHLAGGLDPSPGGIDRAWLESCVRDGVIRWHGHVDDIRPHIAACSVYVLPSYREGKPRSTQEAMAMARPIVTTDAPGCRDTVREGVNGFMVPPRDSAALAAAMARFLEHPELIAPMGSESRRMAEEQFDVRRINATILASMGIDVEAEAGPC
jgi:glycosyltransferase involved in cell wall biosynthesis